MPKSDFKYHAAVPDAKGPHKPAAKSDPGNGERPSVSIHDVADAARVSIATVSRVMNNPRLVSTKTAARVQEVIKKLGYVPNPFAQGLITRESRVLGIALPDIYGEFYSELLRGADGEARRLRYHLLVSSESHDDQEEGRRASPAFGLIDGLAVMITDANSPLSREARESAIPTVVLDTDLHKRGVDSIVVDNAKGTREATQHLLESVPPSRCYFVGGPAENFDTQQRAGAFTETLIASGCTPDQHQVTFGQYTLEWGRQWALAAASHHTLNGSGVLAGNDEIACGIMQVAEDSGVEIPRQLRVIGFDDTRLATLVRPRLSTVRVPMREVGAAAIRLLVQRVEDRTAEPTCIHLPTALIIRESSVGPAQ